MVLLDLADSSVATDSEGRPRGFGTALFAAEKDAATAVNNYHGYVPASWFWSVR